MVGFPGRMRAKKGEPRGVGVGVGGAGKNLPAPNPTGWLVRDTAVKLRSDFLGK